MAKQFFTGETLTKNEIRARVQEMRDKAEWPYPNGIPLESHVETTTLDEVLELFDIGKEFEVETDNPFEGELW